MRVTYTCPGCQQTAESDVTGPGDCLRCTGCGQQVQPAAGAFDGQRLSACLACPSTDLFVRKDFPQRLGVLIVCLGFGLSTITWAWSWVLSTYAILFATALADFGLYWFVPNALMCYRCQAQYRGVPGIDEHGAFELETHERYRQLAARLGEKR